MQTKYEVRFRYYQYNTGRGDNGIYSHSVTFFDTEETTGMEKAIRYIAKMNLKDSEWLRENFRIDGYVENVIGIFKVTEEKVA